MYIFEMTQEFREWLFSLRDKPTKSRILARIRSAELGNIGDAKPVGDGVSEMRIHFGAGYRLYFKRKGDIVYLLLAGGDKSTQSRDIARAIVLAKSLNKD